ncbi:MAG: DNA topoisomerase IV subunit A [Myxococcota bacterium]|nr:DNA topoisomerase IV subunit A [Myxococcota bacterium]
MAARKKKAATRKKTASRKGTATRKKTPARKPAGARKKGTARKKTGARKKAPARARGSGEKRVQATDAQTTRQIDSTAKRVHQTIRASRRPDLALPVRALSNVSYDTRRGYLEIGRQRKVRTLSVNTVKNFAQTLRMMALSKELIGNNDFATKREAYYISKNWEDAKFDEQVESDTVMDDIEALFSVDSIAREQLRFYPEEHGGSVSGPLLVIDRDATGRVARIDCSNFGSGAYSVPTSVEELDFETSADFVLLVETGGMFQRLQSHRFWERANCILVEMGGVPTRAVRRFVRRLADEEGLPVYAFTDCDPYGVANIYRTLKVGSGSAAHINRFFCVPTARFLGVTPQDIVDYELPTHPLKDVDVKRAKDALKNDPFFQRHKEWRQALEQLVKMGVRAEQQALAKWGLNYVIDEYLPQKLERPEKFLP